MGVLGKIWCYTSLAVELSWDYNAIITMLTRRRSRINGD